MKEKFYFIFFFLFMFIFSDYFSFFSYIFDVTVLTVILSFIQSHSRFPLHRTFFYQIIFRSFYHVFLICYSYVSFCLLLSLSCFIDLIDLCKLFPFIHMKFRSVVISVLFSYISLCLFCVFHFSKLLFFYSILLKHAATFIERLRRSFKKVLYKLVKRWEKRVYKR